MTEERLGETHGGEAFTYALRARKQIGMVYAATLDGTLQEIDGLNLASNAT